MVSLNAANVHFFVRLRNMLGETLIDNLINNETENGRSFVSRSFIMNVRPTEYMARLLL